MLQSATIRRKRNGHYVVYFRRNGVTISTRVFRFFTVAEVFVKIWCDNQTAPEIE